MHMGPNYVLVNLSVEFKDTANADEIEEDCGATGSFN